MIFRGRQPEATIWRRFRSGLDGFAFWQEADHYVARIVTNAERALDLFHTLSANLAPAVDVAVEDVRRGRTWKGVGLALPDVRDAVARLKLPISAYGGVELAVYTPDDQLTLTPALECFVYSRTDRWLYILLGKGLVEQEAVSARRDGTAPLSPAPELATALDSAIEQLGLEAVAP